MAESGELHPNWRALSTVHIPFKVFVTAGTTNIKDSSSRDNFHHEYEIHHGTGDEIKKFYDETISITTKSHLKLKSSENVYQAQQKANLRYNDTKKSKIPFDKNKFFRAAMMNDIKTLENFDIFSSNSVSSISNNDIEERNALINCRDGFGWSALMMAACEGSKDTFKFLLDNGADINICDKKSNTAYSLALKKNFHEILKIIYEYQKKNRTDDDKNVENPKSKTNRNENSKKKNIKNFYCEECKMKFNQITRKEHETSTIHQFNMKHYINYKEQRFRNIANDNRGLKLMLKQGWDKKSGLGPSSKGNLFPVKTVIRKQRTGLGIEQDAAKVTHFKPNDLSAIKHRTLPSSARSLTRRELRKQQRIENHKEKYYRNELS